MHAGFRHIFRSGVAGSAGAGAASLLPSSVECRAAKEAKEPVPATPLIKDLGDIEAAGLESRAILDSWTATRLLPDGNFTFEEVDGAFETLGLHCCNPGDYMQDVLDISAGRAPPDIGADCAESTSGSSVVSSGSEADHNIKLPWKISDLSSPRVSAIVQELLNNAEVQAAVCSVLDRTPEFEAFLQDDEDVSQDVMGAPQEMRTSSLLLPAVGSITYELCPVKEQNMFEVAFESLRRSLGNAGTNIASFFGNIAFSLRQTLLGEKACETDASSAAGDTAARRHAAERRARWKGAIFSLAVAVFVMVVFKRRHATRCGMA